MEEGLEGINGDGKNEIKKTHLYFKSNMSALVFPIPGNQREKEHNTIFLTQETQWAIIINSFTSY